MNIERRYSVEGHKNGKVFREGGPVYGDPAEHLAYYQKRIDNPPAESWQPTITRCTITERMCSPWATIMDSGDAS